MRSLILTVLFFLVLPAQTSIIQSGPMVGYGLMTEVMLWVQTSKPAAVQYNYWNITDPQSKLKSIIVKTLEENANIAKTVISGLKPGMKFEFEVLVDGKPVRRNYPLRFQTQMLWQWRTDPAEFAVAFGSCAYINEPEFDRPDRPYGSDYQIFDTIAAKNPDLFIWGGDNAYLREPDWDSRAGIIHRHEHTRALPEMQRLLGSTHNYAVWDDHDFGPNDADRSFRLREESLEIFKLFWANQTYGTTETNGTFGRFVWNDVEFFLLDDRYHRSPNLSPADEHKTMFGKEQLQWIKDALSNSAANTNITFRIIVNGNQSLNTDALFSELLSQFPVEYTDLLGYIKKNKIPGIIFLSGDRHLTELIALKDSTFYTLYDFTCSALTSGLNPLKDRNGVPTKEFTNSLRVNGTLVNDKHNFGMLKFSGKRRERVVSLECYDLTGAQRWVKHIKAEELRAQ
ncbi:MAG: alkaline phosphatase D family protein [Bacteriovoracaceae bacterium]